MFFPVLILKMMEFENPRACDVSALFMYNVS